MTQVKLPSDELSPAERQAMNGEVKSISLNKPMDWAEFKTLADDLKVEYIKRLRVRFALYDSDIAAMMKVSRGSMSTELDRLKIRTGMKDMRKRVAKEAEFREWCAAGGKALPIDEKKAEKKMAGVEVTIKDTVAKALIDPGGSLVMTGKAEEVFARAALALEGIDATFTITWREKE